jgi:hypothetical protein
MIKPFGWDRFEAFGGILWLIFFFVFRCSEMSLAARLVSCATCQEESQSVAVSNLCHLVTHSCLGCSSVTSHVRASLLLSHFTTIRALNSSYNVGTGHVCLLRSSEPAFHDSDGAGHGRPARGRIGLNMQVSSGKWEQISFHISMNKLVYNLLLFCTVFHTIVSACAEIAWRRFWSFWH